MPELPEVETIKRGLTKFLVHKKITKVKILCDKSFLGPKELVEGAKITKIARRGKCLIISLDNDITLLIHLRMTGQLIYRSTGTESGTDIMTAAKSQTIKDQKTFAGGHPTDSFFAKLPNNQTRVILSLKGTNKTESSGTLFFNDQRKFGFIKVLPTVEVPDDKFLKTLAKEPWDITPEEFRKNLMRHKSAPIKATILDQKVIAGVGNIYADEALFMTKIHPARLTGTLTIEDSNTLLENIKKVMEASINSGGSTMATYVRADGTKGDYLEKFAQVFRREGKPCLVCGTEIIKTRVAGRGTHICPRCQQL